LFSICYLDDFDYSKVSQNIYSTFYVENDGIAFPDNQWTDFPFAVLRMWCENLISNVVNIQSSEFTLFFMDGPYSIDCKKVQNQIVMQFINNRKDRVIELECSISTDELINSIYKTSQRLIWLVEQRSYGKIKDVEALKNLLKPLAK
jgi:hypothetical protein